MKIKKSLIIGQTQGYGRIQILSKDLIPFIGQTVELDIDLIPIDTNKCIQPTRQSCGHIFFDKKQPTCKIGSDKCDIK